MSIAVLTQVYDETRRLAIAGSSLAPGDFRLKKLIPPLQKAGEKAPVFAKVAELAERLVDGTDKDSADTLLNLSTVVCSVLYTQGETGAAGTLKPLETVDLGPPVTGTSARVLKPLIEALTTTGSGRLEIIQDAVDRKAFRDMRLVDPAIKAIDDPYGEIGDLIADEVLPVFGKSIYDQIRSDFDIKGRGGHVRRLRLLHKLDPAATKDLVEEALESGSKEMKVAALAYVGNTGSGLNYLLDQVNAKAKDVRSVALAGLATSKNAKAVEALIAALSGKDAEIAIGPASQNRSPNLLKYLFDESQAQLETALTEKTKAKRGAALSRLQLLLRGFVERSDKKSVDFLKSIFDRRDELSEVKGSGASSADGNEIVSIVTQLLVTTGNKPMLKTLAESHAGLPSWALQCCFVSAMQTMTAKEVYDEYSPYLLAKEPKKKSRNDQTRERKEGIVSTLIDVVEGRHAWRYDARYYYGVDTDFELGQFAKGVKLDPRWLEAAMKIDDCNLAMLLKRPGDKALNDYLSKQLTGMLSKRDKEWEISHVLEAMIEIEHPDIVELFMQCLQKLLGRNRQYHYTYWISRLIPSLPKAAIKPLEEMIPSMPDKAADEIIPHIADLKTRHGG